MTLTSTHRRLLPPILLILLALLPVWPAVVLGHAIGPVDHIRAMVDPASPKPETPWNVLQADSLLQFRVWRGLVFEGWAQGRVPTWNPYSLLGTPLLANSQSGALYPLHILMGVIRMPLDRGIGLLAWFHLALAGIGTYRLCRSLGTDRASAFFGGSGFMLSAFLLAWTPLASVPSTVAWIPWLLFWVQRRGFGWLAACAGMMLLAGHLQFAAYGMMAAGLYGLVAGAWRMLPALALGGALAAAQVMPVMAFSQNSHRRAPATEEGYAAYSKSAIQPWQLGALPAPDVFGLPQHVVSSNSETGEITSSYWPSYVKIGENFAEASLGISPIAFVMLALAPLRRREVWGILAVAITGLLLALPTALPKLLYFALPGWSATGSPGRAGVLFVLGASVLAALGLARALAAPKRALVFRATAGLGIAVALVLGGFALAPKSELPLEPGTIATMVAVAGLGCVAGAWLLLTQPRLRRVAMGAAAFPAVYAFVTYAPGLIPTGEFPTLPSAPAGTRVAVVNDHWSFFGTPTAILPPNLLAAARIVDTGGYDSLVDRDTKAMLDEANGGDSAPPENGNMMFVKSKATDEKLRDLGVTEVWSRDATGNLAKRTILNGFQQGMAWAERSATSAPLPPPKLTFRPDGIDATQVDGTRVVVLDRNLPGWSTEPGRVGGGRWLNAELPEGVREVRFRYDPPGLRLGALISAAACLLLAGGAVLGHRRRSGKIEATFPSQTMRNGSRTRQNSH